MKKSTKQVIAAAAVLALILAVSRFLPKGLDKAVWTHKSDPKHVTIINYDAGKPPAVGVTLAEERSAEMMEQLSALHGRYAGRDSQMNLDYGKAQYLLRFETMELGEPNYTGESGFAVVGQKSDLTVGLDDGKTAIYKLGEADHQGLCDLCDSYLYPEGGYPGLAFLQEFFSVKRDGRWSIWESALLSSYSGAMAEAIEPYHEGLEPYVTAEVLKRIELGRYLSRMELSCMAEARDWEILIIRMDEKSVPGSYNFWVDLRSTEEPFAYKTFSGSYVVNKEGLISNFFIDLEE